jgi:chloride channel 7
MSSDVVTNNSVPLLPQTTADAPSATPEKRSPGPGSVNTAEEDRIEEPVLQRYHTAANQKFDSLDFMDVENTVMANEREAQGGSLDPAQWKMWVIILIIGVLTGTVAYGIDQGIHFLNKLKFSAVTHFMDTTGTIEFMPPYLIYTAINLVYVSIAAALVIFGEPMARGSGIGEIKCYLNGIRISRVVRAKTLACKAIGILFSVASGLPCGKEGPMIHSGAAIGSGVATGKSSKFHCDTGFFKEFRSDSNKRNFVTAGAAAGVAAAFGAPIGGLLFAVEEVGSFWKPSLTVLVFVCSATTPWVLQFLADPTDKPRSAVAGLIDFGAMEGSYNYSDLPFLALLGVIGGGFGAMFIKINIELTKVRQRFVKSKGRQFAEVLVVSFLTSTVLMLLVLRGYTCVDNSLGATYGRLESYGCPHGQYNDMATYFLEGMEHSISLLIHSPNDINYGTLVKQLVPYCGLTILTYGIYVPSGLFLPTLALGATFGHLYAQVWNSILPGDHYLNPAHYALFGGTAVLAGVVRMTISVVVIMMEATGNISFFYPLAIITFSAKLFGDLFNHGVYEEHIHLNKIPLLDDEIHPPTLNNLTVASIMNQSVVALPIVLKVRDLCAALQHNPHNNGLLIVGAEGVFRGLLLRRSALIIIDHQAWKSELCASDFVKCSREREFLKLKKYEFFSRLTPEDHDAEVNLQPYIDQWPITVQSDCPVPRVFRTFRELGLRHIVVVDKHNRPVGLVGRKNLCSLVPANEVVSMVRDASDASIPSYRGVNHVMSSDELVTSYRQNISTRLNEEWEDAYKPNVN